MSNERVTNCGYEGINLTAVTNVQDHSGLSFATISISSAMHSKMLMNAPPAGHARKERKMTNESISGFLNSIAEAKRAFDAEPDYQRQIRSLEDDTKRLGETVAARELRIHSLKQDNDSLLQKLRSVEAERDDAGFRALEEADKVSSLLTLVHGVINDALKALSAVEGKESLVISKSAYDGLGEEIAKVRKDNDNLIFEIAQKDEELQRLHTDMRFATEQLQRPLASQGAAVPSSSNAEDKDHSFDPWHPAEDKSAEVPTASVSDPIPQGLGQSEVDPTAPIGTNISSAPTAPVSGQSEGPFAQMGSPSPDAKSATAVHSTDVVLNASPPERNRDRSTFFSGRKYFDVTYFVPLHQWLNEGGSREDYYWRPSEANVPLPEANRASHQS